MAGLAKWFCGCGFVCAEIAVRCFFSARIVITVSAIAACIAAAGPTPSAALSPIAGTSRVRRADSITVTGSGSIGSVERRTRVTDQGSLLNISLVIIPMWADRRNPSRRSTEIREHQAPSLA